MILFQSPVIKNNVLLSDNILLASRICCDVYFKKIQEKFWQSLTLMASGCKLWVWLLGRQYYIYKLLSCTTARFSISYLLCALPWLGSCQCVPGSAYSHW